MATTKFSGTEREKLFAQLEVPFDPAQIKWRVMRTSSDGRSGVVLPFADPRAYTDRLNQLFTPAGWTREYTISTVPSLCRMERGKSIVTSKVLVAAAVTIARLGSHTGTGEEWADRENAVTAADAQAFKRACSCFGLGRYLYSFGETWVNLNQRGEPVALPVLPAWALPPGVTVQPINGPAVDVRGPVDHRLTAEIEGFRSALGVDMYQEILRRAGHSKDGNSRMERLFLEHTFRWLVMEGVLVLVIPFERLHECAGVLSSHFARLNIFRMTDEESVRFRQIAVLGVRRNVRGVAIEEARRQLQRISPYGSFQALPELVPGVCEPYPVPPTGEAALSYRGLPYDLLEDLLPLSGAWKQTLPFLMSREDVATGRPITPLHGGHVGLLCTAGLLNGVFGQDDDRHIARWRSVKHVTTFVEEDGDEQIIHHRERWANELRLVYADGRTLKLT